jgi:hypothetical protein
LEESDLLKLGNILVAERLLFCRSIRQLKSRLTVRLDAGDLVPRADQQGNDRFAQTLRRHRLPRVDCSFFGAINQCQLVLLQGLRRISDLARANVLGALVGSFVVVLTISHWGKTVSSRR